VRIFPLWEISQKWEYFPKTGLRNNKEEILFGRYYKNTFSNLCLAIALCRCFHILCVKALGIIFACVDHTDNCDTWNLSNTKSGIVSLWFFEKL